MILGPFSPRSYRGEYQIGTEADDTSFPPPARLSWSERFLAGAAVKVHASPIGGRAEACHHIGRRHPPHTIRRRFSDIATAGWWKVFAFWERWMCPGDHFTSLCCGFPMGQDAWYRVESPPAIPPSNSRGTPLFAERPPRAPAPLFCFEDPWLGPVHTRNKPFQRVWGYPGPAKKGKTPQKS